MSKGLTPFKWDDGPSGLTVYIDPNFCVPLTWREYMWAMVQVTNGNQKFSSTFNHALETGELTLDGNYYHLSADQLIWLSDKEEMLDLMGAHYAGIYKP